MSVLGWTAISAVVALILGVGVLWLVDGTLHPRDGGHDRDRERDRAKPDEE